MKKIRQYEIEEYRALRKANENKHLVFIHTDTFKWTCIKDNFNSFQEVFKIIEKIESKGYCFYRAMTNEEVNKFY